MKVVEKIINNDTVKWLEEVSDLNCVVTSMPDSEETNMNTKEWIDWFINVATNLMKKSETYSIFYQTDRKIKGTLMSKTSLLFDAAKKAGVRLLWHKIVLKVKVGKINLYRPGYTHLLCFSKEKDSGKATPDVIECGKMFYKNSIGDNVLKFIFSYLKKDKDIKTIVDPFCGQGSILCSAKENGYNVTGVEILPEYCKITKQRLKCSGVSVLDYV